MGITNSTPVDILKDTNILESIKSKRHSVVSFNDNPQVFNRMGNVMVNELYEKDIKGNMCQKLPVQTDLTDSNSINKNVFITADKKYVRLYADKKCRFRANEEAYATVAKPEPDLFNPHLKEEIKFDTTNFTFIPYKDIHNAYYYKISDVPINTPRLPQFYIKDKNTGKYLNKQFVEYDDNRGTVCRKIPMTNPSDFKNKKNLDYRFQPLAKDSNREVGIDRFPDELNTNANATNPDGTPVENIPISIYTDVIRDINDNIFDKKGNMVEKDEFNEPIINDDDTEVTCGNIHTTDNTAYPISGGYRLEDKFPNDSIPDAKPNQKIRYSPIPYSKVKNYGTIVADRANTLYYELKEEKGLLD